MHDTTIEHTEEFPSVGFRARRWLRFERDLEAWLQPPEGRFTAWCAQQAVSVDPASAAGS